jgi:hypothetical protein
MPVTTIVQGKTYAHRHGLLRDLEDRFLVQAAVVAIGKEQHLLLSALPRRGDSAAARLDQRAIPARGLAPVGPAKTKKGSHSRRFEGAPYVAYKAEKRDAHGNGISCSIAARSEHAATLTTFMRDLLDGALFGDAPAPPAPAPAKPEPPRPAPVMPPGTDPYMRLLLSRLDLCGKVLRREENQRDRDYSGGGFYYDNTKTLFLFADGTFRYEQHSFSRVSSGGFSQPLQRDTTSRGTWKVRMVDGKPTLGLLDKDGELVEWWHVTSGGGLHQRRLDGKPWDCRPIS